MEIVFFIGLIGIFYTYIGYFLIVWGISILRKSDIYKDDNFTPSVTLLIPVHNEEAVIRKKLENSLQIDYPKDKLEIFVVSDGSTDNTNKIVSEYKHRGVVLYEISDRVGKVAAQDKVIPLLKGEIIVFSDANTMYSPDSIKKLVRNFADKAVGGVSGDVRLIVSGGGSSFDISENLYYKYERYLQLKESQIWSLICADGAMYAIRRELYKTPKLNAVSCDDVIPMGIVKAGYRVVYEPEAIGVEDSAPDWKEEFRRRVRMAGFGINNFLWARYFPNIQQMWLLIEYISHRLLRWIAPFFLITCFVTNIFLLEKGNFYIGMFIFQVIFYISGLVGMALGKDKYIFGIIFYFCLGNVGNIVGVIKSIMRKQHEIWKPTERRT